MARLGESGWGRLRGGRARLGGLSLPNWITLGAGAVLAGLLLTGAARAETLVERGADLVNGVVACGNCHTPQGPDRPVAGMTLAGGMPFDMSPAFVAYAPNITPDKETGIGKWTDAEIVKAVQEGTLRPGSGRGRRRRPRSRRRGGRC